MRYDLFGSLAQFYIGHNKVGIERTKANSLVPFQPFQQDRKKLRHTIKGATRTEERSLPQRRGEYAEHGPRLHRSPFIRERKKTQAIKIVVQEGVLLHPHKARRRRRAKPTPVVAIVCGGSAGVCGYSCIIVRLLLYFRVTLLYCRVNAAVS